MPRLPAGVEAGQRGRRGGDRAGEAGAGAVPHGRPGTPPSNHGVPRSVVAHTAPRDRASHDTASALLQAVAWAALSPLLIVVILAVVALIPGRSRRMLGWALPVHRAGAGATRLTRR